MKGLVYKNVLKNSVEYTILKNTILKNPAISCTRLKQKRDIFFVSIGCTSVLVCSELFREKLCFVFRRVQFKLSSMDIFILLYKFNKM